MAVRQIILAPDPMLKSRARPVRAVDDDVRGLMDDMVETMRANNGIGLAAPQLGVLERVVVVECAPRGTDSQPLRMANPELVAVSPERVVSEEGCLSLPGHVGEVERARAVTVRYIDETGTQRSLDAEGLEAICVQHELDHLDGILFVDHLSPLRRNMILKKMVKARKERSRTGAT